MPDVALFAAGAALGFPQMPIRPAVSVIAGHEAWERFTGNGTEEDLAAARIAVAARLAELTVSADPPLPATATPLRLRKRISEPRSVVSPGVDAGARCAECQAPMARQRPWQKFCTTDCRLRAFWRRRLAAAQGEAGE